jgi:hypothetical protein
MITKQLLFLPIWIRQINGEDVFFWIQEKKMICMPSLRRYKNSLYACFNTRNRMIYVSVFFGKRKKTYILLLREKKNYLGVHVLSNKTKKMSYICALMRGKKRICVLQNGKKNPLSVCFDKRKCPICALQNEKKNHVYIVLR